MQIGVVEAVDLGVFLDSLRLPPPVAGRALGVLHGWVGLEIRSADIATGIVESIQIDAGDQGALVILDSLPFYDGCQRNQFVAVHAAAAPAEALCADPILKVVQHRDEDKLRPTGVDGKPVGVGEEIAFQGSAWGEITQESVVVQQAQALGLAHSSQEPLAVDHEILGQAFGDLFGTEAFGNGYQNLFETGLLQFAGDLGNGHRLCQHEVAGFDVSFQFFHSQI